MLGIETTGLTKRFGGVAAVDHLDLEVRTGEVMGFLGPNGAGKTTTTRLLLDLLRPSEGGARVLGFDAHEDALEVRRRVGYLPGDVVLPDRLTTHEFLGFHGRLRGDVDAPYAATLIERLDLDPTRPLGDLSKGNRQKAGIVQAFASRPPLLILDEPSSGLDPFVQQTLLDLVAEARAEGRTVFFSSHVLSEVERVADRVAIIREGRLLLVDDVASLRERALLRVRVTFAVAVGPETFADVENVRAVHDGADAIEIVVEGSPAPLVRALARHEVTSLHSAPADLEEIFRTYYEAADG